MPNKDLYSFPNDPAEQIAVLERMATEGDRWRSRWSDRWDRNVALVRGELWPDKASRPLFLANLIGPAIRRKASILVESKPGIDIRPRRSGLATSGDVLKRTIAALFDEQNQSMIWETIAYYLSEFGPAFWKISWDPLADYGAGDICLRDVDPRLMIVDPIVRRATDLWEAQYLREESVVPYSWVLRMFPKTAKDVEPNVTFTPDTNETHKISWFERMINRIRKQQGAFTDEESGYGRVYLQTWWVADYSTDASGARIYPGGRRIFLAGNDVILNPSRDPQDKKYGQANPFWDGLWPYVMLDNQPDLDHPFGQSEVEAARKLNEAFNAVGHTTTRTLIKNVAMIMADAGSLDQQTLQTLKELEEMVIEHTPGRKVERQAPLQPSTTNVQFMEMIRGLLTENNGLSDQSIQGKGRTEMRSAQQLEGLQQAAQVLIRAQARRVENAMERGGQLCISRVFQYYTTDRVMTYIDNDEIKDYEFQKEQLTKEIIELAQKQLDQENQEATDANIEDGQMTIVNESLDEDRILDAIRGAWKLFRFKVIPFSTLASTKIQRAMLLEQMADKFLVPGSMVVKEAGFDNPTELRAQAIQEFVEGQKMGLPPPPPPKGKGGSKPKPPGGQ